MQSGERIVINGRDYRLGSVLSTGAGSYGQVWAATDPSGRAVALKFINTEAMSQADSSLRGHWRAHLEREIAFLAGLDADRSRHIVALLDHGQVDDQPVLVLERLAANLNQWLGLQRRDGAPPPDMARILVWAEQILDGLDVIHHAGFVYRDLKFSNILVGDGGALLKLADFGSLKREDGESTVSFAGTPATMAPEQVLPARLGPEGCEYVVDYRADYYALGLLLFALLTERPATDAQRRLGQLLALHGQEGASQHREQLGGLNDEERELLRRSIEFWTVPVMTGPDSGGAAVQLAELIDRLLARDPAERPRDSAAIRTVLDTVRAGQPMMPAIAPEPVIPAGAPNWDALPPVVPPNRHPRRAGPTDRSPWPWRTAALTGLLGLAGAVAWAVLQPAGPFGQDHAEPLSAVIAPAPPPYSGTEPPSEPVATASPAPAVAVNPPAIESPAAPDAPGLDEPAESIARTASGSMADPVQEPTAESRTESVAGIPAPAVASDDAELAMPLTKPDVPAVVATPPGSVMPASGERPAPARPQKPVSGKTAKAMLSPAESARKSAKATSSEVEPAQKTVKAIPSPAESARKSAKATSSEVEPAQKTVKAIPSPAESARKSTKATSSEVEPATAPLPITPSPATPTVAKSVPKASKPVSPEITRHRPATARAAPAAGGRGTTTPVVGATRPAKATTRPSPAPARPAIATDGPAAGAERPVPAASRQQPAPPAPPPIKLVSRSDPVPPAPPPIKLVSRSDPAPVTSPTRPAPRRNADPPPSLLARAADPITQFQDDAGRATTNIRREAEAVGNWLSHAGKEIQRGLDSANRTVNNWANGGNARVERRDRWSDRRGTETPARRQQSTPYDEDAGFAAPPPRRPQYYR